MYAALIPLAVQVGAPLIRRILSDRFGPENAKLAESVVEAISERLGIEAGQLEAHAQSHPGEVLGAIEEVERAAPEMLQAVLAENRTREVLLLAESNKGGWKAAWRPGWMILLGFLWIWNTVILHVLNAIYKIALPQMDLTVLLSLTGLFLTLYMGGHTVKAVMARK